MATELTKELFAKMLRQSLAAVETNFDLLNELDSATGDGDHGTAILSTLKATVSATEQNGTFSEMLNNVGWGIMSAAGGSTSSLNGAFYLGMANAVTGDSLSPAETVAAFSAGLDNICMMTSARIGDKTMMDAMIPAIGAMKIAAENGSTLVEIFTIAATVAEQGAESTRELTAKQGRAKNLGQRTVGHLDPGAKSYALIMKAFAQAVNS